MTDGNTHWDGCYWEEDRRHHRCTLNKLRDVIEERDALASQIDRYRNIQMIERPIIFQADMVRAILDGRKTQTRRIVKNQPKFATHAYSHPTEGWHCFGDNTGKTFTCPYGQPGDRLWARETFAYQKDRPPAQGYIFYRADGENQPGYQSTLSFYERENRWRPSIHMPRWASRIDLELTAVRVERLQDISEEDCVAEGLKILQGGIRTEFKMLWNSIHGPDAWDRNDWVWVVEFERVAE